MTIKELLEKLGVAPEIIAKIEAGMKENKIYTAGEENLDVRYGKLKADNADLAKQNQEAQALIEELKKAGADSEAVKAKVAEYETKIAQLEEEKKTAHLEGEVKAALLAAKAKPGDLDYLIYKMRAGDNPPEYGKDGKIKGVEAAVKALQTAHPGNFETADGKGGGRKTVELKLPGNEEGGGEPESTLSDAILGRMYPNKQQEE